MNRRSTWPFIAAALLLVPGIASAHDLSDRYGPFLGAAIHPLTELDHVFPFLAIGLYAGLQGVPVVWRTVASFIVALVVGVLVPLAVTPPPDVANFLGVFNLASFFLMGALVAAALRAPGPAAAALAAIFGLSHGVENGIDLAGVHSVWSIAGVIVAGLIATAPAAFITTRLRPGWQLIAVRVAGSWIAAIGLIVLGLRFRS